MCARYGGLTVTWRESMITGDPEADSDHQRIAGIFDQLYRSLIQIIHKSETEIILNDLAEALCDCIGREEKFMHLISQDEAVSHQSDHNELINKLSAIIVDYQIQDKHIVNDTISLRKWWNFRHLEEFDRPLAKAVIASRAGLRRVGRSGGHKPAPQFAP